MLEELLEVQVTIVNDPGHASTPVLAWDLDTVHVRFDNSGEHGKHLCHLGGRDILTLPAEGISNAVHKADISLAVFRQEIAGPEVSGAPWGRESAQENIINRKRDPHLSPLTNTLVRIFFLVAFSSA